jgi:hypothetical protein
MKHRLLLPAWARGLGLALGMVAAVHAASVNPADPLVGRWALTLPNGIGWLEARPAGDHYEGSMLWIGGSVLPATRVTIENGVLTLTKTRTGTGVGTPATAGKAAKVKGAPLVDTLIAHLEGDTLKGVGKIARANGAFDEVPFTGKRTPPLPPRPNLTKVKFGPAITLFNGRDLSGWMPKDSGLKNAWTVEKGVLVNRPPAHAEGEQRVRTANLRTEREFEDFNLKLDVNVPAGSNGGVYLRGIYEIQVVDSYGKPVDSHNMGALYSRITPSMSAEKPAGEWQTMEMTLVDRHVTVVLNGKTIIDNQPVLGCTGGAMWSDEFRPGPIYLQGDHGAVSFRNIVLRPVVK